MWEKGRTLYCDIAAHFGPIEPPPVDDDLKKKIDEQHVTKLRQSALGKLTQAEKNALGW